MKTVIEKLLENAELHPDKLAVVFESEEVTYGQLKDAIIRLASWFKLHGVTEGDRIVAQAAYCKWYIAAYYAAHLCGAIIVPVEKALTQETLQSTVERMEAKAAISWLEPAAPVSLNYGEIDAELAGVEIQPYTFPDLDLVANIMLTSGTTGTPKGAMLTQRNLAVCCIARLQAFEIKEDNVGITFLPLNHVGCSRMWDTALYNGSTYILLDGIIKIRVFFNYMDKYHVTAFNMPPSGLVIIEQLAKEKLHEYAGQIDYAYIHASAMEEPQKEFIKRMLPNSRLYQSYGSTEGGLATTHRFDHGNKNIRCAGSPCQGVEVKIVGEDYREMPCGELGRIVIRSEMNFIGYWGMPELTEESYHDGYLLTSDAGYIDDEGFLYIKGRIDDIINIGGLKVYPSEIEEAALAVEGVSECICYGISHAITGNAAKLLVVLKDGSDSTVRSIRNVLSKKLDTYKIPASIEIVQEIKKNAIGKPDRKYYKNQE